MSIESVPADMRTTSTGAYQALYALGIFGGPLAAGFFNDWLGFRAGFYFAGCSGWRLSYLLICGEPMRKLVGKKQGRCGKVLPDMVFLFLSLKMISFRVKAKAESNLTLQTFLYV
ncbi:hypothetical protein DDT10_09300 [Bacillus amyloliquefaciens]|nr:hypothetical protein BVQ_09570 [Bacillus velezensis]AWM51866.1 hypothetical protein DDT10_09300 [Bacillus amyloliquefaciens]